MQERCRLSEWSRACAPQLAAKDKVSDRDDLRIMQDIACPSSQVQSIMRQILSLYLFDCVNTRIWLWPHTSFLLVNKSVNVSSCLCHCTSRYVLLQLPPSMTTCCCSRYGMQPCYAMAKQLHFNKDGSALKKMQAGVDKLASVVGITLGPKVHCLSLLPSWAACSSADFLAACGLSEPP